MSTSTSTTARRSGSRGGVRTRLLTAIAVVAATTMATGLLGVERMAVLSQRAQDVYTRGTVPVERLEALRSDWWANQAHGARQGIAGIPPQALATEVKAAAASRAAITADVALLRRTELTPGARRSFATYRTAAADYFATAGEVATAVAAHDPAAAQKAIDQLNVDEDAAVAALDAAVEAQSTAASATARTARATYERARAVTLALMAVGLLLSVLVGLLMTRSVMRPLREIRDVLGRVAGGDLRARSTTSGRDELAAVATSVNETVESLASVMRLVSGSATTLSAASRGLDSTARAIAGNAAEAAEHSSAVSTTAGGVSSSVDTVAAGSGQMEIAIEEIAHSASAAAQVAAQAVDVVATTTATVGKLGDSSQQIASVVKLITAIAEQTNLLALNATIEAARAGEAGKGFAVVASEVKELAQETARATEDISSRVVTIQADTAGAVAAIGEISEVIGRINDFQATIAAAVEEQTATSQEMTRNVADAARGSRDIASKVSSLAAGTQENRARVTEAQRAASELASMSAQLQQAVARYTV